MDTKGLVSLMPMEKEIKIILSTFLLWKKVEKKDFSDGAAKKTGVERWQPLFHFAKICFLFCDLLCKDKSAKYTWTFRDRMNFCRSQACSFRWSFSPTIAVVVALGKILTNFCGLYSQQEKLQLVELPLLKKCFAWVIGKPEFWQLRA